MRGVHRDLQTAAASAQGMLHAGAAGPQAAIHAVKIVTQAPIQAAHATGPASTGWG